MEVAFNEVIALTGSPGLFKVLKTDEKAIIVESLDARRRRQRVSGNMMASKLMDISVYTSEDDSEPLVNIFQAIEKKFGKELPVTKKSSKDELMGFLGEVLPDYDAERVYPSNVKKMITWYHLLTELGIAFEVPEEEEDEKDEKEESEPAEAEASAEETPQASE